MKDSVKRALHGSRQAVVVTVVLMLICGLLFPLLLTGLSSLIFPHQANGSLITVDCISSAASDVYKRQLLYVEPSLRLSLQRLCRG